MNSIVYIFVYIIVKLRLEYNLLPVGTDLGLEYEKFEEFKRFS